MQREIEYIEPDRDALKWAIGCMTTSYLRRLASLNVVQMAVLRWIVSLFIGFCAVSSLSAARLFYVKVSAGLELGATGYDYRKSMPWLDLFPTWTLAVGSVACLFYLIAAYCLVRKKAFSVLSLLTGTALSGIALAGQVAVVLREYGKVLSPEGMRDHCLMFALQFCAIVLLWHGFQRSRRGSA